jgi:hypothetical protein
MIQFVNKYLKSDEYLKSQYVRRKVLKIPEGKLKPVEYDFSTKNNVKGRSNSVIEESINLQNNSTFINKVKSLRKSINPKKSFINNTTIPTDKAQPKLIRKDFNQDNQHLYSKIMQRKMIVSKFDKRRKI